MKIRCFPSSLRAGLRALVAWVCSVAGVLAHEHEDRLAPAEPRVAEAWSEEWTESTAAPAPGPRLHAFAALAPAARQPVGALSGRIVFMNGGHGWTFDPAAWRLQRPTALHEMNEDYGNLDQMNLFAAYCFNAGATVVPMRPLGQQTNEVVLDNDDPGVVFVGGWANSTSPIFWGSAGDVAYRFASLDAAETATATYTPTIPQAGFYPVYCWTRHGSDRGDQLYRIRHTGGESRVRVPHHRVGNGWVYLGEYHFEAGANAAGGSVVISNLRGSTAGSVVIADAIRFGNGMGSVDRGGGVSRYPREEENMRYWVQSQLAQGQATSLYEGSGNDEQDGWSAPPKMSAEMNRGPAQTPGGSEVLDYKRVHLSFHSNAGGGRGTVGLITGTPTPNQAALAEIIGREVNDDLVALGSPPLEVAWLNKSTVTYSGGYSEITGSLFNYEMDATILEVAFHDNESDARLLRDPKARAAVAKAAMQGLVRYFRTYDTAEPPPLIFLPEPPTALRARAVNTHGHVALNWSAPVGLGGSFPPTNYVVYLSTNGLGFGQPIEVGNVLTVTLTNLPVGVDHYFRVAASNAGGESMPSEVVGCRAALEEGARRVLVVNAFDHFDRTLNLRQDFVRQSYMPPGRDGANERVLPRRSNAFSYVVPHGRAIAAAGWAFDSCQNEAVANGLVPLSSYAVVVWACGNESTGDETFSSSEQARVSAFLDAGGALLVSGSDVAFDLGRPTGPTVADRAFLQDRLKTAFVADDAGVFGVSPVAGGLFAARGGATADDGDGGIYRVPSPDRIAAVGTGARLALGYAGTGTGAAVQYDGSAGGGRVVVLGVPFESLLEPVRRAEYMADILAFLAPTPMDGAPIILGQPTGSLVEQGTAASLSVAASGSGPLSYQWRLNDVVLAAQTNAVLTRSSWQTADSGRYAVVVANAFGAVTSAVALVEVGLPGWTPLLGDTFSAVDGSAWRLNRSSSDTRVTFGYDHAVDGIPTAPTTSDGSTRAVKFEANLAMGAAAAVGISPVDGDFSGEVRLAFDLWINANGPFPGGGIGSTEHALAGIGTAGDRVHWTGAGSTADGVWFAVNGDGGSSDTTTTTVPDFAAFTGTTSLAAGSGAYAAGTASNARGNGHPRYTAAFPGASAPAAQQAAHSQQIGTLAAGAPGFAWRKVVVARVGNTVTWSIDGLEIAAVSNAVLTASNVFVGYWDSFASVSDNPALSFALVDNLRVERFATNVPPYLTGQPAGQTVVPGASATFQIDAGGTGPLAFQWRRNGVPMAGANSASLALQAVTPGDAGIYSVTVSNAVGGVVSAEAALVVAEPVPVRFELISLLPENRVWLLLSAPAGSSVTVETSETLPVWNPWTNVVVPNGSLRLTDQVGPGVLQRFYRATAP